MKKVVGQECCWSGMLLVRNVVGQATNNGEEKSCWLCEVVGQATNNGDGARRPTTALSHQHYVSFSFYFIIEVINAFGIPDISCSFLCFTGKSSVPSGIVA